MIKTAPDLSGLTELVESVVTGLQETVRDRYQELVTMNCAVLTCEIAPTGGGMGTTDRES